MAANELNSYADEVTRRLAAEYAGSRSADAVARCVRAACEHFSNARVDAFVPVLIARHARRMLRAGPHAYNAAS